jgi:transglutaminase superfamily protein
MKFVFYIFVLICIVFTGCSSAPVKPVIKEHPVMEESGKSLPEMLKNPRFMEAEMILRFKIKKMLHGKDILDLREKMKMPPSVKPCLYVWCPEPMNRYNQEIKSIHYSIPPALTYDDADNGNRISYWNLTSRLPMNGENVIELSRKIKLLRYETEYKIDPEKVGDYNRESALYKRYTRNEPGIELTDEIKACAKNIVGDELNPYRKAEKIFLWVLDNLKYKYPPKKRGAAEVYQTREGDCGEYSYLFCAFCRSVGVPARFVSGLWFREKLGFHVWAEYYLPGYGWIPADASKADSESGNYDLYYFGGLENTRFTASKGNNLPIKKAPSWATYKNSEVEGGITPFMQFSTIAGFGVEYELEREYHLLRNELIDEKREEWTSFK